MDTTANKILYKTPYIPLHISTIKCDADGKAYIAQSTQSISDDFMFRIKDQEILKFCEKGDIFIHGERVDNNPEIYEAFKQLSSSTIEQENNVPIESEDNGEQKLNIEWDGDHNRVSITQGISPYFVLKIKNQEILKFCGNGDTFIRGEKVDDNLEIYVAFKYFLFSAIEQKNNALIDSGNGSKDEGERR